MSRLKRLISEIHHRSLWQVLLIYVGAGWVVFEIVQTVTEGLGLPLWFPAFAALLLLIGLPVVLATAFVREGEPAGAVSDPTLLPVDEARTEAARNRRTLTWRNAVASFVVALAVWGLVATAWMLFGGGETEADVVAGERPSVAALPFVNRSGLEADEYFTDGMHDEILTLLSKIGSLSVRGRTSVMQYRDTEKNLRQIGTELNARYILEGGVQRAGGTVRINLQLVDAESDEHVWAETYDRPLTVENLLGVQSEVALRVAEALKATLTPEEADRIEQRPTENLEAYEAYLTARDYARRGRQQDTSIVAQSYERAIALDPQFALAYAELSTFLSKWYYVWDVSDPDRLAQARALADTALGINPDLAAVHIALGTLHYYGEKDYDRALEEYAIAANLEPNNSEVYGRMATVQRRAGHWEDALASAKKAVELDPRDSGRLVNLGTTYIFLRDYSAAITTLDRAIAIVPDNRTQHFWRALATLLQGTDRQKIYEAYQQPRPRRWVCCSGRSDLRASLRVLYEYVQDTVRADQPVPSDPYPWNYFMAKATVYSTAGEVPLALAYYDSARVFLADPGGRVLPHVAERLGPYVSGAHAALGVIYAGLGAKDEAIREARLAVELLPISEDAVQGTWPATTLAEVYAMVGEHDAAIDQLEYLLSIPAPISVALIRIDPIWDPLRDYPRFQALLDKYE